MKFIIFLALFYSSLGYSGSDVGNGGDLVRCYPHTGNDLVGLYSLDYLIFRREQGAQPVMVKSWQESIFRVRRIFVDKLPELLPVFDEFANNILNTDHSRRQIWEPTDYTLREINDEDLPASVEIPINCKDQGKIQLIQAVIRQNPEFTGSKLIVYKYMPRIFEKTANERPLQLSFLLVHEFLWSLSNNVDRNRRINWFLHSEEIETLTRLDVIDRLLGMGLDITSIPRIVDARGRGHFTTLQDAIAQARFGETIIIKEGIYSTGGAIIVNPMRLVGEGDKTKIIIKGGASYPVLELNLEKDFVVNVENVTLSRYYSFDRDSYNSSDVLKFNSGKVAIRNSVVKGNGRYLMRLSGEVEAEFNGVYFEGDEGILLDPYFKGRLEIYGSKFVTRSSALYFKGPDSTRFHFEDNDFALDPEVEEIEYYCPIDLTAYDTSGKKKEFLKRSFGTYFKNNRYSPRIPSNEEKLCYF